VDASSAQEDTTNSLRFGYVSALLVLPLIGTSLFPALLGKVTDFSIEAFERQKYILALLLSKRVYLYGLGAVCLNLISSRCIESNDTLGKRIESINKEVLAVAPTMGNSSLDMSAEMYGSLDAVDETTQASSLPFLIAGSLVASFLGVQLSSNLQSSLQSSDLDSKLFVDITTAFGVMSNVAVSFLFTTSEFRSAFGTIFGNVDGQKDDAEGAESSGLLLKASAVIAAIIVGLSFTSPPGGVFWPLQNIVNICITVTVARLFQLNSFPAIALALLGLTAYDALFVYGTQQFTDSGASIMEAVARAKLGLGDAANPVDAAASAAASSTADASSQIAAGIASARLSGSAESSSVSLPALSLSSWRPGLFAVSIDGAGRVSDALGLADVVFPAILTGWAKRWDKQQNTVDLETEEDPEAEKAGKSLYSASLVGFGVGCVLCEVLQTGAGQPALLYLVPSMLTSVLFTALLNGQISDIWTTTTSGQAIGTSSTSNADTSQKR
jgi:hypothetical protein